ncbi:MAG TPA: hypothetical protein VF401_00360 [Candidatus Saccharimonadales bacterium]
MSEQLSYEPNHIVAGFLKWTLADSTDEHELRGAAIGAEYLAQQMLEDSLTKQNLKIAANNVAIYCRQPTNEQLIRDIPGENKLGKLVCNAMAPIVGKANDYLLNTNRGVALFSLAVYKSTANISTTTDELTEDFTHSLYATEGLVSRFYVRALFVERYARNILRQKDLTPQELRSAAAARYAGKLFAATSGLTPEGVYDAWRQRRHAKRLGVQL